MICVEYTTLEYGGALIYFCHGSTLIVGAPRLPTLLAGGHIASMNQPQPCLRHESLHPRTHREHANVFILTMYVTGQSRGAVHGPRIEQYRFARECFFSFEKGKYAERSIPLNSYEEVDIVLSTAPRCDIGGLSS